MFLISGRSVTVVEPAVWSGALLKALYDTSVTPLKKNNPPNVTINDAIPVSYTHLTLPTIYSV